MGDMGDYWRDVREIRRADKPRRDRNARMAIEKLESSGAKYARLDYHHFRVYDGGGAWFDFWPSTGLWIEKGQKSKGRGIDGLLKTIKEKTR